MDDQYCVAQLHRVEPRVEVSCVVNEAIGIGRRRAGLTHSDEVGSKTSTKITHMRNDVAPEIGRRWVPVQENDGITFSHIYITHFAIENGNTLSLMWVGGLHFGVLVCVAGKQISKESARLPWRRRKPGAASRPRDQMR